MYAFNKWTGARIVGTAEKIPGTAIAFADSFTRPADGGIGCEYTGDTNIDWDGQTTELDEQGRVFVDEHDALVSESDIYLTSDEHWTLPTLREVVQEVLNSRMFDCNCSYVAGTPPDQRCDGTCTHARLKAALKRDRP